MFKSRLLSDNIFSYICHVPTPNELLKDLPAFYKQQIYHSVLFGWVRCWKKLYPSATTKEMCFAFMAEFEIEEGQLDLIGLMNTYNKVNKNFFNAKKQEHRQEAKETNG